MKNKGFTVVELLVVVVPFLLLIPVLALWTNSNMDFWISHFKGHAVHVSYFLALILTVVGNGVILFANVVAQIAQYLI